MTKKVKEFVNVSQKVDKILTELEQSDSFNKVPILRLKRECTWSEQSACFVLQFDTLQFDLLRPIDNDYVTVDFDYDKIVDDFRSLLTKRLPGCTIDYHSGCHEWEVSGPQIKNYYKKHADAIESWYEQHPGFSIYVPKE